MLGDTDSEKETKCPRHDLPLGVAAAGAGARAGIMTPEWLTADPRRNTAAIGDPTIWMPGQCFLAAALPEGRTPMSAVARLWRALPHLLLLEARRRVPTPKRLGRALPHLLPSEARR